MDSDSDDLPNDTGNTFHIFLCLLGVLIIVILFYYFYMNRIYSHISQFDFE